MLAHAVRYPCLAPGVSLVNPENTDVFFLYLSRSGERYELNQVSFEMIRRMNGRNSLQDICREVQATFVDAVSVSEDLQDLIEQLVDAGIADWVEHSTATNDA